MKITKIKKDGMGYKIVLNNGEEIITSDDVILENKLLFDKTVDKNLIEKIKNDTEYYKIYNRVLNWINVRIRSEKEVNTYLKKYNVSADYREKIIYNLKRIGFIDDYKYARAYTNDKMHLSLDGPYKISRDLEEEGIDSYIITEMIESYPKELIDEHIDKLIDKRLKANKRYSGYVLRQKLSIYLRRLGYKMEDINNHLDNLIYDTDFAEKEMEKLYKKYALKYEGDKLYLKLKSALLSRGFKNDDIENFFAKKQF